MWRAFLKSYLDLIDFRWKFGVVANIILMSLDSVVSIGVFDAPLKPFALDDSYS